MYQKCVCFLFLVILAVLSCSAFHIDSLVMADFSKKNVHTSTNTHSNTDKYIRVDSVQRPHRIRHHRLWRTQAHDRYPKSHIETVIYPPTPPPPHFSSKSTPAHEFPESTDSNPTYSKFSDTNLRSESRLPLGEVITPTRAVWPSYVSNSNSESNLPFSTKIWPSISHQNLLPKSGIPSSHISNPHYESNLLSSRELHRAKSEIWPTRISDQNRDEINLPLSAGSESNLPFSEVKRARGEVSKWILGLRSNRPSFESDSNDSLASPTIFPNENLAQIPPTDLAPSVKFVVSRAQRSSDLKYNQHKNKWSATQSEDIFAKAYKAKFVIIAEVESKQYVNESNGSCQCYVKVIKDFKGNVAKSFGWVHNFYRRMLTVRCDLVKELKNSKKYVWLLDDKLQLLDVPKPREKLRQSMRKKISRVCKSGFVPTKPIIVELKEISPKSRKKIERRNRILMCSVRGFPLPRITWRRKNEILHHNSSYNVLYKRRQSKLVIKKPNAEYLGQYECVAESLNGLTISKNVTLKPPQPSESFSSDRECPDNFNHAFCQNGGTCFYEKSMGLYGCVCPDNFSGEKCELKKPSNTSMYPQPDLYACNLGLSTKYNC